MIIQVCVFVSSVNFKSRKTTLPTLYTFVCDSDSSDCDLEFYLHLLLLQILVLYHATSPPPSPHQAVYTNNAAISVKRTAQLSCVNLDPSVVYYCSVKICQPFVHQCPEITGYRK
jgi:hypothetical protein